MLVQDPGVFGVGDRREYGLREGSASALNSSLFGSTGDGSCLGVRVFRVLSGLGVEIKVVEFASWGRVWGLG